MALSLFTKRRVSRRVFVDVVQADTPLVLVPHGFGTADVDVAVRHPGSGTCDGYGIGLWAADAVLVRFPETHQRVHVIEVSSPV